MSGIDRLGLRTARHECPVCRRGVYETAGVEPKFRRHSDGTGSACPMGDEPIPPPSAANVRTGPPPYTRPVPGPWRVRGAFQNWWLVRTLPDGGTDYLRGRPGRYRPHGAIITFRTEAAAQHRADLLNAERRAVAS